jgi:hypothetical protein
MSMNKHARFLTALFAMAAIAVPAGAFAQSEPAAPPAQSEPAAPPAQSEPAAPPSYAAPAPPSYGSPDETIHGRIESFDGAYNLQLRDDRGFIDNVRLQQGTVINPTGLRLTVGMTVTIHGANGGKLFAAREIDTPYSQYGPVAVYPYGAYPYPAYPYAAYPYPYPGYGFGYPYPGVSIGIGFGFGFGGRGCCFGGGRRWR